MRKNTHFFLRRFALLHTLTLILIATTIGCQFQDLLRSPTPTPPTQINEIVQSWSDLTGEIQGSKGNTIVEAWNHISDQYIDKNNIQLTEIRDNAIGSMAQLVNASSGLEPDQIRDAAITAMLNALNDPYAAYMNHNEYANFVNESLGKFSGIGVRVGFKNGQITVISPILGSPADRQGISSGDIILEVDGTSTDGWNLMKASTAIRGPKGTKVRLLIQQNHQEYPVSVEIIRDDIDVSSVDWELLSNGIARVSISGFADDTDEDLQQVLSNMETGTLNGIILDLRSNPGGLLDSTVGVASQFLDEGLVLYMLDSDGNRTDYPVESGGLALDIPMAVLVNQYSASGSEVLASALRDHDRSIIIGTKTFGKGSVNIIQPLSDGSAILFTTGHWYSPDGYIIEGLGIEPDHNIKLASTGNTDAQVNEAIVYLTR
jgi:carboxyl-terminal processing protease